MYKFSYRKTKIKGEADRYTFICNFDEPVHNTDARIVITMYINTISCRLIVEFLTVNNIYLIIDAFITDPEVLIRKFYSGIFCIGHQAKEIDKILDDEITRLNILNGFKNIFIKAFGV